MAGPDDLLAELPAPNPDEPVSLRRDIADELADHLECAVRRESLKTPDPQMVEHRVIARFGDPKKIARKLWLDAMKEILMTQKITLALFSIVAIASLAACGLMWSLARDFQSVAADAQAASAKLLSQGQETNAELLKQNQEMMQKLTALANREADPKEYLDWIPLQVEVVKADAEKSPAKGFAVQVRGKALTETEEISLHETTTDKGIADFGVVRPGYYYLEVDAPWGERESWNFLVKPGTPHVEKIESPANPPKEIQAKPIVTWPKELEGKGLAVLVDVSRADYTKVGEMYWSGGGNTHLLIRPDGRYATYPVVYSGQQPRSDESIQGFASATQSGKLVLETVHFGSPANVHTDSFAWKGTEAALSNLRLVKLSPEAEFPGQGDSLSCISPHSMDRVLRMAASFPGSSPDSSKTLGTYKADGERRHDVDHRDSRAHCLVGAGHPGGGAIPRPSRRVCGQRGQDVFRVRQGWKPGTFAGGIRPLR